MPATKEAYLKDSWQFYEEIPERIIRSLVGRAGRSEKPGWQLGQLLKKQALTPADKGTEDSGCRWRTRGDSHRDEDDSKKPRTGAGPWITMSWWLSHPSVLLIWKESGSSKSLPATRSHWKWWVTGNGVLGWVWATDMSQVSSLGSWGVGVITWFLLKQ